LAVNARTADIQRILSRLDAPDFNVKDVEELKRYYKEDTKYWLQHPFWGAVYGKLLDYVELYCIQKNMSR
jgi:hypothetical protein